MVWDEQNPNKQGPIHCSFLFLGVPLDILTDPIFKLLIDTDS